MLTFVSNISMINHTNHTYGVRTMNVHDGKYAWMVKIGEKGQFVIPKEARDLFGFRPGEEILVLGDEKRGIAILPKDLQQKQIELIFSQLTEEETSE